MLWEVVMLCREKKMEKTLVKLKSIKQPKLKKIHKKPKLIKFLRNAKTIKTKPLLK